MRGAACGTVLALLAALQPAKASAQAPPGPAPQAAAGARDTARGLTTQAVKLYDAGEFARALELFEKADALYPTPQYRVYVARAYAKLGKLQRAVAKYDEAMQMPLPPGAPPSFVEAQKTAAEERAEIAKRLPSLRIDVAGAPAADVTLTVDGEPVPSLKWARVELDPGSHRIEATAPRTRGSAQTVELREGATSSVLVTLQPLADAAPRPWRPLAITSGALGGAGLIVAIISGAVLAAKRSSILDECPNHLCTPAGRALINSVPPIEHANLAGWIGAATGTAAAAVFLYLDLRGSKPATALVPAPLPGGGGVWVTRRF
ncbi:MAG: hypothetical protein QM820_46340 [Minicystis sp.]